MTKLKATIVTEDSDLLIDILDHARERGYNVDVQLSLQRNGSKPPAPLAERVPRPVQKKKAAKKPTVEKLPTSKPEKAKTDATTCKGPNCENPVKTKGLCNGHYQQWNKRGRDLSRLEPLVVRPPKTR